MPGPILLCTDGSDVALDALSSGLALLGREHSYVVVTVADEPDEGAIYGSGHAGPDMTVEEYEREVSKAKSEAERAVELARARLGIDDLDARTLHGDAGPAICQLASQLSARAIVIGTRGHGGLKRALLGSVSDYVVRNAPCAVVITNADVES
jgi:nucleotide-binding universal stress UspA family protein